MHTLKHTKTRVLTYQSVKRGQKGAKMAKMGKLLWANNTYLGRVLCKKC